MSNPTDADWKRISKVLDVFFQRPDSEPFREPVAWKELGLEDYPKIIKHPMDLGTIKNKLKAKKYTTLFQVNQDVHLVWKNCMTYNADGSDFFKLAESLQKKWDDKYTKVLKECNASAQAAGAGGGGSNKSDGNKVSLQDKRLFAKSLYTISKEDLGRILVEVENKCPAAIVRNAAEDEVELNVDKIGGPLLSELNAFVQKAKKLKKPPANNKKQKVSA